MSDAKIANGKVPSYECRVPSQRQAYVDSLQSQLNTKPKRYSAKYAAKAAKAAKNMLLMLLLQLRIDGFYHICNNTPISPTLFPHSNRARGSKCNYAYEQFTTGGER